MMTKFTIVCVTMGEMEVNEKNKVVNTDLGNGFLPGGTEQLPEPVLTYRRSGSDPLAFIPGQCLLKYLQYQSPSCVGNLHIWNNSHVSQGTIGLNDTFIFRNVNCSDAGDGIL